MYDYSLRRSDCRHKPRGELGCAVAKDMYALFFSNTLLCTLLI